MKEAVKAIPTCGFNVEELTTATGMKLSVIDVGGGRKLNRAMYCTGAEGLIFVVDSSDEERFSEARDELKGLLLAEATTWGIPFVVMANKQDIPESVDPSNLIEALGLREFNCNKWTVQGTSAATGEGLRESIETLCEMIKSFRKERR
ncbi:ADP-ribosylation factor-like protein 14 [Holothuria leucospilota]|uniref:ADP-ribosylation factor-like protein 14 n=1 Tax=Holothuria leucospilota TaxID=206669 RepID=A0A9Q1CGD6_HOLLE|nr:ADP-ribosylation factor-like protein 14 [Holothuria leucospilota]